MAKYAKKLSSLPLDLRFEPTLQSRGELKGVYVLLSRTQAGPCRAVKQDHNENSRKHVQAFKWSSVQEKTFLPSIFR